MMTIIEILNSLNRLPEEFAKACEEGKWCKAAVDYENAVKISRFIQMDEEARDKLLDRFDKKLVIKAYKAAGWYKEEADAERETNRKKAV